MQQTQRQIGILYYSLRVLRRWKNRALPHSASAATAALGRLRPAHRRTLADDTINRRTQASTAHRRHSGYRIHCLNVPQSALFASGCKTYAHPHRHAHPHPRQPSLARSSRIQYDWCAARWPQQRFNSGRSNPLPTVLPVKLLPLLAGVFLYVLCILRDFFHFVTLDSP